MELELFTKTLQCSKRNVLFLLVVTLANPFPLLATLLPPPTDSLCFQMENGQVVLEAENYSYTTPGLGAMSGLAWETYNDPLASEGLAVRVSNGAGGGWTGLELSGPRLDYDINFSSPGTYRLWVRCSGPTNVDDSFPCGIKWDQGYTNTIRDGDGQYRR